MLDSFLTWGGAPGGVGAGPIEGMGKPGAPNHVGSMGRPAWRYRAGDCNCQVCAGNSHIHPNTLCWLHVCKGSEASHAPRSLWPHMFQRLSGLTHSSEIVASSIGDGARVNNWQWVMRVEFRVHNTFFVSSCLFEGSFQIVWFMSSLSVGGSSVKLARWWFTLSCCRSRLDIVAHMPAGTIL